MRFRSADEITVEHVGRRMTVRRSLTEGGTTDVIGTLESLDDATLVLRDRRGAIHRIERSDVVAARLIAG